MNLTLPFQRVNFDSLDPHDLNQFKCEVPLKHSFHSVHSADHSDHSHNSNKDFKYKVDSKNYVKLKPDDFSINTSIVEAKKNSMTNSQINPKYKKQDTDILDRIKNKDNEFTLRFNSDIMEKSNSEDRSF